MTGKNCKALWIKALYKCSPFTILPFIEVNSSKQAVYYTASSPHLVLGSELVVDFRVKTKASTPCGSPGPGLRTTGLKGKDQAN